MSSDILWDVFENTGSIKAFLTYSRSENISSNIYELAANAYVDEKSQKTKAAKKSVKSSSLEDRTRA